MAIPLMRIQGVVLAVLLGWGREGIPETLPSEEPRQQIRGFFARHCADCHGADTQKAGLRLDAYSAEWPDDASVDRAAALLDRVRKGEMPPKNPGSLSPGERRAFLSVFGRELENADRRLAALSRPSLRRMNRVEFECTLRDLLALPDLHVKEELPEDGRRFGFDKVAGGLDCSHIQISKVLGAAKKALERAATGGGEAPKVRTWREPAAAQDSAALAIRTMNAVPLAGRDLAPGYGIKLEGDPVKDPANSYKVGTFQGKAGSVILFTGPLGPHQPEGLQPDHFKPDTAGWYRVRFSVWGLRWEQTRAGPARGGRGRIIAPKTGEETPGESQGPEKEESGEVLHVVRASLGGSALQYFDAPSLVPTVHEFKVWLEPGQKVSFHGMTLPAYGPPNWGSHDGPRSYRGPAIAFDWFEIEGPLLEQWPPESHRRLFGGTSGIRGGVSAFAERAFRRPIRAGEAEPYILLAEEEARRGATVREALLAAYRSILCSPDFLFLGLEGQEFGLASRLSYFLWNSMPDPTLLDLAGGGDLGRDEVLRAQVVRMLQDRRSDRFVEHFLDEWLEMRNIDFTTPDPHLYPEFDPWLRDSMLQEIRAGFRAMLDGDLGVQRLVSAPEILINQRLADLYDIRGVRGSALRPVPLPEGSVRGGFITQAAVLKVTANGTSTSPVLRGVWISERLLGVPRQPPPPNVPAIEPDARGAVTIRQMVEKHRADPACGGCHSRFDPPGMALESFDAIGRRRDFYPILGGGGKPRPGPRVDPSGALPDGRRFENVNDLRRLLLADPDALARNVIRQLLVYATGSGLRFSDREELESILDRVRARRYGLRSAVEEVVASRIFRQTR